ncbi:Imm58 family immunity protein [Luteibacter pinisoli]|nr:Imm58 family immunity protein [Luteibacter pinisoli]
MSYRVFSLVVMASLLPALGYVTYQWIDVSVSYGYSSSGEDEALADGKRFRRLLLTALKGQDKASVLSLLTEDAKTHPDEHILIKDEGDSVSYEGQDFRFGEKGVLEGIGQGVGIPSRRACGGHDAPKNAPCTAP